MTLRRAELPLSEWDKKQGIKICHDDAQWCLKCGKEELSLEVEVCPSCGDQKLIGYRTSDADPCLQSDAGDAIMCVGVK